MKNILSIIAILALFALACTKEDNEPVADEFAIAPTAITYMVKGDADQQEQESEESVDQEESEADEDVVAEEGDVEEENEDAEEEVVDPAAFIASFVEDYFPETVIAECIETEEGYEVKLEDGTLIVFDSDLEWRKVSCKHSTVYVSVPEGIVPEEITAYVVENYPDNTIMDIKKTGFGWMVTLNNKGKIKFNKDFTIK